MDSKDKIIAFLRQHPPATARIVALSLGLSEGHTQKSIGELRVAGVLEIKSWTIEQGRKINRRRALYGWTGKLRNPTKWQAGDRRPYLDETRIETEMQALAFKVAMRGQRYDSVSEPRAVRRFDLTRNQGHARSSMTWA